MARHVLANNLSIGYSSEQVLAEIADFQIEAGDVVSIIGESGIGKTTFLKTIANLVKPLGGNLTVFGESPQRIRGRIGYIPQKLGLLRHDTVYGNVLQGAICHESIWRSVFGFHDPKVIDKVNETIEIMNLKDKINEPVKRLSGGQQRRVAIARTIAQNPKIILADEFLSELDDETANNVWSVMLEYVKANSITLLIVEHNLERARQAERCFEMTNQKELSYSILKEI
jgi:ABC-type phosphate/phosphonate transport system ATPase subunit